MKPILIGVSSYPALPAVAGTIWIGGTSATAATVMSKVVTACAVLSATSMPVAASVAVTSSCTPGMTPDQLSGARSSTPARMALICASVPVSDSEPSPFRVKVPPPDVSAVIVQLVGTPVIFAVSVSEPSVSVRPTETPVPPGHILKVVSSTPSTSAAAASGVSASACTVNSCWAVVVARSPLLKMPSWLSCVVTRTVMPASATSGSRLPSALVGGVMQNSSTAARIPPRCP